MSTTATTTTIIKIKTSDNQTIECEKGKLAQWSFFSNLFEDCPDLDYVPLNMHSSVIVPLMDWISNRPSTVPPNMPAIDPGVVIHYNEDEYTKQYIDKHASSPPRFYELLYAAFTYQIDDLLERLKHRWVQRVNSMESFEQFLETDKINPDEDNFQFLELLSSVHVPDN